MENSENKTHLRLLQYAALSVLLIGDYWGLRASTWTGSSSVHTIMESLATALALIVGIIALLNFYTNRSRVFLFVGAGFIGTAALDGYHALVTSEYFVAFLPSLPPSLIPWSWIASRVFLSIALFLSWYFWYRESNQSEEQNFSPTSVYALFSLFTLSSFLFFAFVPLPRAYYPELFFGRPEAFIPAAFFLFALIGYLKKGLWRTNDFEHWMVLALIVSFIGQAVFMSFSKELFDFQFDSAHLLKKLSYVCVLVGLLISMYEIFTREKLSQKQLEQQSAILIKDQKRLKTQQEELKKAKDLAEEKLQESERLTKVMVDRELKMVELKKEKEKNENGYKE